MKLMKLFLLNATVLISLCLCLTGCGTHRALQKSQEVPPISVHTLHIESPLKVCDSELREAVRFKEQVKAYPIGRYIDPNNPNILHEAHVLYRREQPARWNHTLQKPTVLPLGPTYAVVDPAAVKSPISDTLEKAFVEQTELLQQLYAQNETFNQKLQALERQVEVLKPQAHESQSNHD